MAHLVASQIPNAQPGERPTSYADRLGRWYAERQTEEHKKDFGQYLTPVEVADFMSRYFGVPTSDCTLLDPAAGAGVLICATVEYFAKSQKRPKCLHVYAYEIDLELSIVLRKVLRYLQRQMMQRDLEICISVRSEDFVLRHAHILQPALELPLSKQGREPSDFVIANPPYFKLPKSDPRAQAAASIVHGQPNIYALFMAVSAALLNSDGQFVFITPRSFASGPYFRLFRERFFDLMQIEAIHVFHSRKDAFKRDGILQENIILKARRRREQRNGTRYHIEISCSNGGGDLRGATKARVPASLILSTGRDKVLHIPLSQQDIALMETIHSWTGSLHQYGLEISTGPVVPFRARSFYSSLKHGDSSVPFLWMQNVQAGDVTWPLVSRNKAQYFLASEESAHLLLPTRNYVLLRRFSAKEEARRLVAAPFIATRFSSPVVAFENHLNYIHRPGGTMTEEEAWGLAVLYNSVLLDRYFRTLNGNTQVSATELRSIPLPPIEIIRSIGRRAISFSGPMDFEALSRPAFALSHSQQQALVYG